VTDWTRRLWSTATSLILALSRTDSCSTSRRITWPHLWSSLWSRSIDNADDELGACQ